MRVLIVVDIQNDFLPGGALAVPEGDEIIPVVNLLIPTFELVVATQDWHPADHQSFASNHPEHQVGDFIQLHGLEQMLWPDHCVQDTTGAAFADALNQEGIHSIFQKGTEVTVDSYSGFFDNGKRKATGMHQFLMSHGVKETYIVGLATDYCVKYTALDSAELGFATTVIVDATRAVNLQPEDGQNALKDMQHKEIKVVQSDEVLNLA